MHALLSFFSDPKLEETRQALLIKSVEFDASLIGLNMYEEAIKGLLIEKVAKKTTESFSSASMLTSKVPHYPIFPSFELTRYFKKCFVKIVQQMPCLHLTSCRCLLTYLCVKHKPPPNFQLFKH